MACVCYFNQDHAIIQALSQECLPIIKATTAVLYALNGNGPQIGRDAYLPLDSTPGANSFLDHLNNIPLKCISFTGFLNISSKYPLCAYRSQSPLIGFGIMPMTDVTRRMVSITKGA